MHKSILGGIVACGCLVAAGPAAAAVTPVPLTFDHVVLDTQATPKAQVVSPAHPLKVTANVDTSTGQFTVQPSDWSFPTYTLTSPVKGSIAIGLNGPATGQVNPATGQLALKAGFVATITLQGYGQCVQDVPNLTLSTSATAPLPGKAFPAGTTGLLTGAGAFGGDWSSLPPGTGPACSTVDAAIGNKGGIWISRGINPVPTKLALTVAKPKTAKAGRTAVVKATLANRGGASTTPIKVCLTGPKSLRLKTNCKTVKTLGQNAKKTLSFRVKTVKHKTGKYKLTVKATAKGVPTVSRKVTLKVR